MTSGRAAITRAAAPGSPMSSAAAVTFPANPAGFSVETISARVSSVISWLPSRPLSAKRSVNLRPIMPAAPKIKTCMALSFRRCVPGPRRTVPSHGVEDGLGRGIDAVEMAIEGGDHACAVARAQPGHDLDVVLIAAQDGAGLRHRPAPLLHQIAIEPHDEVREQRVGGAAIDREVELAVADEEAHG